MEDGVQPSGDLVVAGRGDLAAGEQDVSLM